MKRTEKHYFKAQSTFTRIPAAIQASRCSDVVGVRLHPGHAATEMQPPPACIWLTPHEAQGFAAWLSQQADALLAKQAKAAARKAARKAAREQQQ
jgi:hypothetical protein